MMNTEMSNNIFVSWIGTNNGAQVTGNLTMKYPQPISSENDIKELSQKVSEYVKDYATNISITNWKRLEKPGYNPEGIEYK